MNAESLLTHLSKVKRTAHGEWVACCPAHEDRSPSLAVKETQDGRILVHCFAGCAVADVCAAVGVELADLFPEKLVGEKLNPVPFNVKTLLKAMVFNTQVVAILASDVAEGRPISAEDRDTAYKILREFEEIVSYAAR